MEMGSNQIVKQMVDLQKVVFNSSYNAISIAQRQSDKMTDMLIDQAEWASDKWKDAVTEWRNAYLEGFEAVKKAVEGQFEKMENYIS